ncbi:MAG: ABC transporter permease subunit, partial [Sphingomonadales bacterium]|nr:ABC transporter permease subunit [Sphingomonadales bacterium]
MSGVQARALQRIRTVFVKEVRDHWRDRRSIVLSLMFPLMAPILVGLLLSNIAGTNVDGSSKRDIRIAVAGEKFAPGLIAYLRENGVAMHQAPLGREAQETALSTRAESVILEIPPEAAGREKFSLTVMVDRNNPGGVADAAELMRHITAFGRATSERLVAAAGLDQTDVTPITVEEVTVGRAPNTAFLFYNLMAPLIMFMIFMGAVYLAIDVTVGERERGSLEPLLTA